MELDPHRLPRHVAPHRYDVVLEPDLSAASFEGEATIHTTVVGDVAPEVIVLNADELEIHTVLVDGAAATWRLDPEAERLFITAGIPLAPGSTPVLNIRFSGVLNDRLRGFYRSTFRDDDGNEHVIATTQMQPTDCRRAFPCWDEPDFKAVFAMTLVVPADMTAVSNGAEVARTPVESEDHPADTNKVKVTFADTMPMSTYLVAAVVGPLESSETVYVGPTAVRILHPPGKGHLTALGLDVTTKCLHWFEDYYGIPYPSDKVDLLALPDFAAGAMENLGCITFREPLLLVDPETSTQLERQHVADVVAHELAHMWFGDLVTMRWWNGIWLNEAFATFMGTAAVDAYRPSWQRWTTAGRERAAAFEVDALTSTRPIEYEVRTPEDSEGMFDVLTYEKGGALLRMLEQYIGAEPFRLGVSHYLSTHALGNTETSDLWDALEHTSGQPVRRLMDSWIWQGGFPLVHAAVEHRNDGDELVLRQERFLYPTTSRATGGPESPASAPWLVPVHVRVGQGEERVVLLEDQPVRVPLDDLGATADPVVVNAGGVGFYRVAYDTELRGRFQQSGISTLSSLERYCMVNDAWSAVVADRLRTNEFLEMAQVFAEDDDVAVWQALAVGMDGCSRLVDEADRAAFQKMVRSMVAPVLERLGWEPDPDEGELRSTLRGLAIGLLAIDGGDDDARSRCRQLLVRSHDEPVDAEVVAAATRVVAATGDADDFEQYVERFRTSRNPQEQLRYLNALAEFDDEQLIEATCHLAFSDDVRTQDAPFLLNRCIANRRHGAVAWQQVRDRWTEAVERFPTNTIVRMVNSVRLLDDADVANDVQSFFEQNPIPQAGPTLRQVLERQLVNVALRRRESVRLSEFLRSS